MEQADWISIVVLAAVLLAVYGWLRRRTVTAPPRKATRQIAIDGTNVLFWRDEVAQLQTLRVVVDHLRYQGIDPVIFLDASSRHHIGDKSLDEQKFARALGVPQKRVMVCPARTEADAFILQYAGEHKLPVVSNDRFRDRPREARNIRLIRGRFNGDRPILKGL